MKEIQVFFLRKEYLNATDMAVIYLHCVVTWFVPKIFQDCNYYINYFQSLVYFTIFVC